MRNATINRFFFAIRPPLAIARRVVGAMSSRDWMMLAAERLHLTMFILDDRGEVDPSLVATLVAIGDALRVQPVAIELDRLGASQRSVALRPATSNAGIRALHAELARLARGEGVAERQGYRFGAHMTVGYRDGAPSNRPAAPVGWIADEVVLIHSHVGRTRHEEVGRWSLAGDPGAQLSLL